MTALPILPIAAIVRPVVIIITIIIVVWESVATAMGELLLGSFAVSLTLLAAPPGIPAIVTAVAIPIGKSRTASSARGPWRSSWLLAAVVLGMAAS